MYMKNCKRGNDINTKLVMKQHYKLMRQEKTPLCNFTSPKVKIIQYCIAFIFQNNFDSHYVYIHKNFIKT